MVTTKLSIKLKGKKNHIYILKRAEVFQTHYFKRLSIHLFVNQYNIV